MSSTIGSERTAPGDGRQLNALAFAAAGVARAETEDDLFAVLVEACDHLLPADAATFGLYDAATGTLHFLRSQDRGETVDPAVVPVRGTPAERVLRERRPLLTLRSSDPAAQGTVVVGSGERCESVIRCPVVGDEQVLGLLTVQSYTPGAYSHSDVALMEILAANAATALINLRFRRQLSEKVAQEREAREALATSEERHRALLEYSHDLIVVVDAAGALTYVSPSSQRILGYPPDELVGRGVFELMDPDERERAAEALATRVDMDDAVDLFRFRHRDGRWKTLEVVSTNRTADRAIGGVIFNARDVTDRAAAEKRGEEVLRRLKAAQAVARIGDWEYDPATQTATWSAEMYRIYGLPPETPLTRETLVECTHPDDRKALLARARTAREEGDWYDVDFRIVRPDGEIRHLHGRGLYELAPDGAVTRAFGTCQDVSLLRQTEETLRRTQERTRLFVAQMPAVLWLTDRSLRFTWVDGGALDNLGQDPSAQIGLTLHEYFGVDDDAFPAIAMHLRALRGERVSYEMNWGGRDFDTHLEPLRGDDGAITGTLGFAIDVSERRVLEQRLRDGQRLESIGRLAGGVAHDFNNILTVIDGHADMLVQELREGDPAREDLEEIRKSARRASQLTRQLLAFSRRQVLQPRVVDLNASVTSVERMLQRLMGEDVRLTTELAPDLDRIEVDPGQFEQILMNLAANARDAMPGGGALTISTGNERIDAARARRFPYSVQQGRYVRVRVQDTGHGMAPEVVERAFEPFFTTKAEGHGTGLGLATVYGIVKQSGGYIWIDSAPGRGTRFDIYFPRVEREARPDRETEEGQVTEGGRETILLVEDEDGVRSLARRVLQRKGYRVLEAANGGEALLLCERHGGSIDLLVTDVVMPQMSGMELVERLRDLAPDLRPLFMSGYTADEVLRRGVVADDVAFLQKPFTPDDLARKVREVLDRG